MGKSCGRGITADFRDGATYSDIIDALQPYP